MPAAVQLVPAAPGADPVAAVRAVLPPAPAGFGTTLWLAPTPAHAGAVRRRLGGAAVVAPAVFDVQAFADELVRTHDPTARPLTAGRRRLLLDAAVADLRDAAGTRGFLDAADGLVRELKRAGVDPKRLARAGGADEAARVYAAFEQKRAKLRRLDPDDRQARAAELWAAGRRRPFEAARRVAVVGFTAFTDPQRRLLSTLAETVDNIVVALVGEDGDRRAEVFAGVREAAEWVERLRGELDLFTSQPLPPTPSPKRGGGEGLSPSPLRGGVGEGLPPRPAGLSRLTAAIFGPSAPAADAAGIHLIEAPGVVGEARLVARVIRRLLADGSAPESVVVTARHLGRSADLLHEVFDEYAIPHDWPDPDRLARCPAVAALLRAWRLPDDDFPFADTTAVLRGTFFRPAWDIVGEDSDLPLRAEALLRQLGEPRGKAAYLAAVETWCESPPAPLEDEQAEEPRRKRLQRLARRCRPFLARFFRLWDDVPRTATPAAFADRLRRLAADFGLPAADLVPLWTELDPWVTEGPRKAVPKATFTRTLGGIAGAADQPAPPAGGRVRVLPPDEARGADCDHLFVVGLGEGSFPDLSAPPSLLADPDRVRLRAAGLPLPDPDGRLADEMLLFVELLARPRRTLHLSFPAVDERGQPLLPSSFLLAARECFTPGAVPVTRQRMPIEGYARDPMAAAELRVSAARAMAAAGDAGDIPLSADVRENLRAARTAAAARFQTREFGRFDGLLRHPAVAADLADRVGPAKVLSPTALDAYVACPFRFWLEHVLRLEPLDDPADEVEHTRRGAAVHRALARFHAPAAADAELPQHILDAVEEYALRAASPATRTLWRLEGRRLLRSAARYRGHLDAFRQPWQEKGATPTPHVVEADFGTSAGEGVVVPGPLVISVGGVEVRVGGRIDRVDVAEVADGLGFWVIDYKTGRGQHYTAAAIETFEKLQLPLYAVAVERVLFAGRPARPLGLAYWMVTEKGPKPVLPGKKSDLLSWLADAGRWARFRGQLEAWVAALAGHIRAGDFPLAPRSADCTDTCHFGPACRIAQARPVGKAWPLPLPVAAGPATYPGPPGSS